MTHRCQRILVVNRGAASRVAFADDLCREGLAVHFVNGSDVAFQAIAGCVKPDAILIDLAVKDIGVAEFLRRAKATHAVPIIAISPGPIMERIGPTADREVHEFFDGKELLAVLDDLCTSPRSPAGRGR